MQHLFVQACHEIYGQNPTKRKFIKECRDIWYEICFKRYSFEGISLQDIHSKIDNLQGTIAGFIESNNTKNEPLSLGKIIDFLLTYKTPTEDKKIRNFETFYLFVFGTNDNGDKKNKEFNTLKNFFLEFFGRMLAEKLVLYLIEKTHYDWNVGLTEPEGESFILQMEILLFAIINNKYLEFGNERIGIIINEDKEFVLSLKK
jgi:hypothetical protein